MFIYIIILCVFGFLSIISTYTKNDSAFNLKLYILCGIILIILLGLRYDVGVDFLNYQNLYSCSADLYIMKETGFIKIIELFNMLNLPFFVFCFFYAWLTVWLIFRFVKNNSPYLFLSIFIYYALGNYYFSSFNAMRQALAVAIFMNCLQLISNGKLWKYLFIILISSFCVHFSSLILIPLYFILRKKYANIVKLTVIISIIMFGSIAIKIIEVSPYAIYLAFENFVSEVPLTYYLIGFIAIITFIYSLLHPEWERRYLVLSNMNIVVILLLCLIFLYENTPLVMVFNRLLSYFTMIYIVILPLLYAEMRLFSNRRIFIIVTSCMFGGLCIIALIQNGENNNMVPYKTIFNQ